MIEAYIDETGTDYAGAICAVAGFVSTPERWSLLRNEWRLICDEDPKTPDFHAYDAHNLRGAYWGWEQDQSLSLEELARRRDGRILALVHAIRDHCQQSLSIAIDLPSYRRIVAPKFPRDRDVPYFIMFWHMQLGLAKWMVENNVKDHVQFVFDDFSRFGRRAAAWHSHMLEGLPPEAAEILRQPPRFAHDKHEPALKAADLFAWHIQRDVNSMVKLRKSWTRANRVKAFAELLAIPTIGQLLGEAELTDLLPVIQNARM